MVDFAFAGNGIALPEDDGESKVVRGVRWLEFLEVTKALCRVEELRTEEAVLACELAEPTALRVSPGSDSTSSDCRCVASETEPSRPVLDVRPGPGASSACWVDEDAKGLRWPFVVAAAAACVGDDSCTLDFARSRSVALSLAARGADGKN